ncbi:MAG: sel1 repeat family protein, partial [Deltaproteobacteria bacterium]|nr:sel1 repeat family protein [Deltaproteobacteria bacterium]
MTDKYLKDAEKGDPKARYELATLYAKGEGVARDGGKAAEWLREAAELGHPESQTFLGTLHLFGDGVEKNHARTVELYEKAAGAGYVPAQYNLGVFYRELRGEADYEKAAAWLRKAAERGNAEAAHALGCLFSAGEGVRRDFAEASKWYAKAAK